jgi:hypothetical protein
VRIPGRILDVIGRLLIIFTAFWLLIGAFLISANSVVHPGDFLSDDASLPVEAVGYFWCATVVVALVVAVWDGVIRSAGGRWTTLLILAVYALGLLTTLLDPDGDDDFGEIAGIGAFTLGPGMVGGLLRMWARSVRSG